ncbi:hypothetical protein [Hoeflea sp. EC-HK425]|uniref:hypothetical protein n=1 Tax=Hoeflea sp. EC-HK425 TaxID=2038388 RepID=UPI00125F95DE|nr:hypothetical protein [Hoeflea sp. EC-HK425]
MAQTSWDIVVETLEAEMDQAPTRFFATFSRLEWAFGQEGTTYTLKPPRVGINWDIVGQTFGGQFYKRIKEDLVARRLINDPPQVIINEAGFGLRFEAEPPECGDASAVFNALARIRNNFFHGWKRGLEADDRRHIDDGNAVLRIAYEFCDGHPKLGSVAHRLIHA